MMMTPRGSLRSVFAQLRFLWATFVLLLALPGAAFAQANPNQGPGGPILVVTSTSATFSKYYAEILRAEGLNEFTVADISTVTSSSLAPYDTVILGNTALTSTQVTTLTNWVTAGGNLIAMDPDAQLSTLLGLTIGSSTLSNAYLAVDTSTRAGSGIVAESMQYHGLAHLNLLNGASSIATLYSTANSSTPYAAVTVRSVGSNGGQAASFAYDLATSIVYTRQGNPAWIGQERDGLSPRRSNDLFFGASASDPQADWVDKSKIHIPQADEQQRLFSNLILFMNSDKKPLPRFWYLPRGLRAAVVMTGDDHALDGAQATTGRFNQFLAASPAGCNVANWECVRGTSYLVNASNIPDAQLAAFETQGFEVGLHVNTQCQDYNLQTLTQIYSEQLGAYHSKWPSMPNPDSMRHHCIVWSDWVTGAKVELANGIRLDTNYYYWPDTWVNDVPGHFTGSAMPMRFADTDGTIVDVYQAVSQMTDESEQQYPYTVDTLLDRAVGPEGQYGVYTINAHTDTDTELESDSVLASAPARGVPIVSARQMLTWLDGRNSSSFGSIAWSANTLTFTVTVGNGATGLQGLLPRRTLTAALSTLKRSGANVPFEIVNIKGLEYVAFSAAAGSYSAVYAADTTAPTITARSPASGATNVALASTITATFSEALNPSSVSASTVELRNSANALVPASISYDPGTFGVRIQPTSPLAAGATFTVTVRGGTGAVITDVLGTALAATSTWSFTTTTVSDGCPCFGWTTGTVPTTFDGADPDAVNVGVKFRAASDGVITGIRFFKATTNTGTHIGALWNADGSNITSATFIDETASGWQQVNFSAPVPVTANTVYVASYLAPAGHYSVDSQYFANSSHTNGALTFLQDGTSGGNGVFAYGSTLTFPNQSFHASNYWVDVVYASTGSQSDATAPVLNITSPTSAATYSTSASTISIGGTASDDVAVTQVSWVNSRGGSGTALGTSTWTANGVVLLTGSNVITVTARDAGGNTSVKTLTVTLAADTTAPTVATRSPAAGATGVGVSSLVSVSFNEALTASSVTTSSFELRTSGGTLVPATVSYNPATMTAALTPSSALAASSTYTVNVKGGATDPRIKDAAGNALASTATWTFTTTVDDCPCTTWDNTVSPGASNDPDAVNVGAKFRTDAAGQITAIRFYKAANNTGAHTGYLWSAAGGPPLATVTFTNETASGWQEAPLSTPVNVLANTTYVVSYYAPNGNYSADENYFANTSVTRGPLTFLQAGIDGGNGVFAYGGAGVFPNASFQSTNYWVDVTFVRAATGPDTTPPTITTRNPASGGTNVATSTPVTVTFSEALTASTVSSSTFELRNASNVLVTSTVSYNTATRTATLTPSAALTASTTYTVTVRGGTTDPRVKDVAGNALAANATWSFTTASGSSGCSANAITAENCLTGNLKTEWDINGAGDPSIQGYATEISVNRGSTIQFKVDTDASAYRFDIYRMGYYNGRGARFITSVPATTILPQGQDPCRTDTTGLIDCGNWVVTGSWPVPSNAVSGVYFAKVTRTDTGGASHIVFIVRDDASTSKMVFQTSDTTWQAYNDFGGNSLYKGSPGTNPARAYKVSYNRPFATRGVDGGQDWVFNAEYPMIRWLEANGYDVSYISGLDTHRSGSLLLNHKVFLSVGHDEYWSGTQRTNVEAARNAGVHLAFFSGNEVFWKTRWEPSIVSGGGTNRTLVSYKETHANGKIDPTSEWTGTWRDGRFSTDGGKPENALTGTLFKVNVGTAGISVPAALGKMRLWRNSPAAALGTGQTANLPDGLLGYEWDEVADNGAGPAGLIKLSSTTVSGVDALQDLGSTYATGTVNHSLTMYKHSSGALVFGAGTIQWPWGLESEHDRAGTPTDQNVQQLTYNLFADMGVQPATIQAGLITSGPSTDTNAPTVTITTPAAGATVQVNAAYAITGTATEVGGGLVGGVEVSVDGGTTWHGANGRESWAYSWTPTANGAVTIRVRAVDDSGNISTPVTQSVTVASSVPVTCPCSVFNAAVSPVNGEDPDTVSTQLGMKFQPSQSGTITGIRFYKLPLNTGTHVGTLWTTTGQNLATVTFPSETASGWQQVNLPTPIAVTANTTYIVAYQAPNGRYSADTGFFATSGVTTGPLRALADGESGGNGVYAYGNAATFPDQAWMSANYYVDVVFQTAGGDTTAPALAITAPTSATSYTATSSTVTLSGTASDAVGVTQVTWANSAGGSGTASGTTNWSAANVALSSGSNVITITARDAAGNASTKTLTVSYTAVQADTTKPTITITSPTSSTSYSTTSSTVTLGGTSTDNVAVTQVTWTNSLGGSGTATGTANWSASGIVLTAGLNTITVTAVDAAGNVGTDTLAVTYSLPVDTTKPTITITSPTTNTTTSTSANTITLGGTATDNVGVTQVTWSSSIGVSGTATGTTTWSATAIPLINGSQVLTVTARDAAGNTNTDTLTVSSSTAVDTTNPTVTITGPTSAASITVTANTVTLSGTAADNRAIKRVAWGNNRGGSGDATGTTSWTTPAIALQPGVNTLTITAYDLSNRSSTDTLTVTFNAPITYGQVAAYSFNEGSGAAVADSSGNNNLGTVTNGSWTTSGKFGNSLVFNGTSSRVFVTSSASLNLTAGMTVMAWVYPTANQTGNRTIIRRETNGYWLYSSRLLSNMRPYGGALVGSNSETVSASNALPVNTWSHVAVTYDGSVVTLYVNGTAVSTNSASGSIVSGTTPLWIGGTSSSTDFFQGRIDEVRVYNRALTTTEIGTIRNTAITP